MSASSKSCSRLRILVAGRLVSAERQGGAAWAVLQWVLGFRALGHSVILVELTGETAADPEASPVSRSTKARHLLNITRHFGLGDTSVLLGPRAGGIGQSGERLLQAASESDVLVDLSGVLAGQDFTRSVPVRVYVDLDPGFTQLWHVNGFDVGLDGHTHYATVGQQIGREQNGIPDCGRTWIHTFPPVVLEYWPVVAPPARERFTTVANWRSYGSLEYNGTFFGQKAHSFRQYLDLPSMTSAPLVVAMSISPGDSGDHERLVNAGWQLVDAAKVVSTPGGYKRFIQTSSGEIGIAKSGYVAGQTGWISDRTVAYLASGRPVVAQDSGIGNALPTGLGLLTSGDASEAADGIERVRRDYLRHSAAARKLAESQFDARIVLGRLLRAVGVAG